MEENFHHKLLRRQLGEVLELNETYIARIEQLKTYIIRAGFEVPPIEAGQNAPLILSKEFEFTRQIKRRRSENPYPPPSSHSSNNTSDLSAIKSSNFSLGQIMDLQDRIVQGNEFEIEKLTNLNEPSTQTNLSQISRKDLSMLNDPPTRRELSDVAEGSEGSEGSKEEGEGNYAARTESNAESPKEQYLFPTGYSRSIDAEIDYQGDEFRGIADEGEQIAEEERRMQEQFEREQREQREREQREQREREQREREREQELREQELREQEQREREQREKEQREQREKEQREKEQREREQREKEQREQHEREQREKEREQREKEQREQREKEREQEREQELREQAKREQAKREQEQRERNERELARKTREAQFEKDRLESLRLERERAQRETEKLRKERELESMRALKEREAARERRNEREQNRASNNVDRSMHLDLLEKQSSVQSTHVTPSRSGIHSPLNRSTPTRSLLAPNENSTPTKPTPSKTSGTMSLRNRLNAAMENPGIKPSDPKRILKYSKESVDRLIESRAAAPSENSHADETSEYFSAIGARSSPSINKSTTLSRIDISTRSPRRPAPSITSPVPGPVLPEMSKRPERIKVKADINHVTGFDSTLPELQAKPVNEGDISEVRERPRK